MLKNSALKWELHSFFHVSPLLVFTYCTLCESEFVSNSQWSTHFSSRTQSSGRLAPLQSCLTESLPLMRWHPSSAACVGFQRAIWKLNCWCTWAWRPFSSHPAAAERLSLSLLFFSSPCLCMNLHSFLSWQHYQESLAKAVSAGARSALEDDEVWNNGCSVLAPSADTFLDQIKH